MKFSKNKWTITNNLDFDIDYENIMPNTTSQSEHVTISTPPASQKITQHGCRIKPPTRI